MVITSKDNRYIRLMKELSRKKYREKYGLFLAEGKRLVDDLLAVGLSPHVLLYDEDFRDIALLEKAAGSADHCFAVAGSLFRKLAETEHDQGILAAFPMICPSFKDYTPKESGLILILNGIQDPGNLGAIIRSAAAAGVNALWLEDGCVELYNPKVIRSTMGCIAKIPIFSGLHHEEITAALKAYAIPTFLADMHQAVPYDVLPVDKTIAVVMGNEGNGISENWRKGNYPGVMIPMENGVESLNVAMAAAIIAFDYRRRRSK